MECGDGLLVILPLLFQFAGLDFIAIEVCDCRFVGRALLFDRDGVRSPLRSAQVGTRNLSDALTLA